MKKVIIQLENINAEDFKNEIISGTVAALKSYGGQTQTNSEIILSRQEVADLLKISLVSLWDMTRKDKNSRISNR